jgi:hypothetical protein
MANKAMYVKKLANGNQFCLVIGYVGEDQACVFERNPETFDELPNTTLILPTQQAIELYKDKN